MYLFRKKKVLLSPLLQPIKVEHLYGIAADAKVNRKLQTENNFF